MALALVVLDLLELIREGGELWGLLAGKLGEGLFGVAGCLGPLC